MEGTLPKTNLLTRDRSYGMVDLTTVDIERVIAEIEHDEAYRQKVVESVLFLSDYFNIDANKLMGAIKKII